MTSCGVVDGLLVTSPVTSGTRRLIVQTDGLGRLRDGIGRWYRSEAVIGRAQRGPFQLVQTFPRKIMRG